MAARQPGFLKRGEPVRLQAFLARSGIASRRAAEEMITHGRIAVNGETVTAMGLTVVPGVDRVEVDGEEVKVAPTTWLALHKPRGYVTTRIDPYGRRTVYDLLPEKYHGLFHVGRLDRDSEGLLLLTNDGELANRFLHPSYGITKEYDVVATGKPTDAELRQLVEGVELEDGVAHAESARLMGPAGNGLSRIKMVLREGKKREVRRMLAALGHEVTRLVRRRFGPIELGELPKGKYRVVQPEELSHVRQPPKKTRARDTHHAYDVEPAKARGKSAARTRPTAADGEHRPRGKAAADEHRKPARGGAKPSSRVADREAPPKRPGSRPGTKLGTGSRFEEKGKKRRPGQEQRGRPADLYVPPKRPRDERSTNEWEDDSPVPPRPRPRSTSEWEDAPAPRGRPADRAARPSARPRPDREYENRPARPTRTRDDRDEWEDADDRVPRARGGGAERGGRSGARAGGTRGGPRAGGTRGGPRSGGTRGGFGAERGASRGGRAPRDEWEDRDEPRGGRTGGAARGGSRGGRFGGEEGGSRGGRFGAEERGGSRPGATRTPGPVDEDRDELDEWSSAPRRPRAGGTGGARGGRPGGGARGGGARAGGSRGGGGRPGGARGGGGGPGGGGRAGGGRAGGGGGRGGGGRPGGPRRGGGGGRRG